MVGGVQPVELAIHCTNLIRTGGLLMKVNPSVEVWRKEDPGNNAQWEFVDKTETIFNEVINYYPSPHPTPPHCPLCRKRGPVL